MTAASDISTAESRRPTAWSGAIFAAKAVGLRFRRALTDLVGGPRRLPLIADKGFSVSLGACLTPLHSAIAPEERAYELGKIENLRQAARRLDGVLVPAGSVFSFWRQLGPATSTRGFVVGRMLQEGCLVPAVGGGLCQLSNSLFDVALQAGCGIVERHRHSRRVPGSTAAVGRDATVAWNYVDLRFRAPRTLRLSVSLNDEALCVALSGQARDGPALPVTIPALDIDLPVGSARTCATCDEIDCYRHEGDSGL